MFPHGSDDEDSMDSDMSQVQMAQSSNQAGSRPLIPPIDIVNPGSQPFDPKEPVNTTSTVDRGSNRERRLNQYTIITSIGSGRKPHVFEFFDRLKNMKVVAKRLSRVGSRKEDKIKLLRRIEDDRNSPLDNIRKEVALMKRFRHANIVRLIEIIDDPKDEYVYLVMEYLEGGPVQWERDKKPLLTLFQIRRVMRDTILGLEYLHHEGIIHRDIKPDNIIWTKDRQSVKLIDYGVAYYIPPAKHGKGKQAESDNKIDPDLFPESDLRKTAGTPAFLAPEVVWTDAKEEEWNEDASTSTSYRSLDEGSGKQVATAVVNDLQEKASDRPPITKSIDIWALGVTFYCFLFGKTPFDTSRTLNEIPHPSRNLFVLHRLIRTQDWPLEDCMGAEGAPTGGRTPVLDPESDGPNVVQLLGHLLQKKAENRITLPDLKAHPWILKDVANPKKWLRQTSPVENENESKVSTMLKSARHTIRNKFMPRKG